MSIETYQLFVYCALHTAHLSFPHIEGTVCSLADIIVVIDMRLIKTNTQVYLPVLLQ